MSLFKARLSLIVIALILFIGSALAYLYLPQATITLTPATTTHEVAQAITLSKNVTDPDFKRFILPAKVVESQFTSTNTINREGGAVSPALATGQVKLINRQNDEQPLLPKTHLRHQETGAMFVTDAAVRIPPQSEIMVGITAEELGAAGNVPAGHFIIDRLPANLQDQIYGASTTPTTGGEVFDTPVSEADLNQAKDALRAQALAKAHGELTAAAGGAPIRDDLTSASIGTVTTSADVGSNATSFTVSADIQVRAFVIDEQDLLSLTLLALRAQQSEDEQFVTFDPSSFSAELVKADFERGEARTMGHLRGTFARNIESRALGVQNLAGRTPAEVNEYFTQFPSVGQVGVILRPFWVKRVPGRQAAITIIVDNPPSE